MTKNDALVASGVCSIFLDRWRKLIGEIKNSAGRALAQFKMSNVCNYSEPFTHKNFKASFIVSFIITFFLTVIVTALNTSFIVSLSYSF